MPGPFVVSVEVPLSGELGGVAIVDVSDAAIVAQYRWRKHRKGYAFANGLTVAGKRAPIVKMHRLIMGAPDGLVVDHINHDKLDNRRANLRACTATENRRNNLGNSGRPLPRGVSAWRDKFKAQIGHDGLVIYLGLFRTVAEAAASRRAAEIRLFGAFAPLVAP